MSPNDCLFVAGDVGELTSDIQRTLALLRECFARVIWMSANHELWTIEQESISLRAVWGYEALVEMCRRLDMLTPEDPYPGWTGAGGPVRITQLFLLYAYTFLAPGTTTRAESLEKVHEAGIVCMDEFFLHPDPYPTWQDWCAARIEATERRLSQVTGPGEVMTHQDFVQWCGTVRTTDWHTRFDVRASVYGHLHIPRSTVYDGVPFGYAREWRHFGLRSNLARQILARYGERAA